MQSYFVKKAVNKKTGFALFNLLKQSLTNHRWVVVSTQGVGYCVSPTANTVNFTYF